MVGRMEEDSVSTGVWFLSMNTGNNVNNILIKYNSSWLAEFLGRICIDSALIIGEMGAKLLGKLMFTREVWQVKIYRKLKYVIAFL